MQLWNLELHVTLLLLSGVIAAVLVWIAWRRRPAAGATAIALLMLAVSEWSFAYVAELLAADLQTKFFWIQVEFIGVVVIPLAWLAFTLTYIGAAVRITPWRVLLTTLIPALTLGLVWTNHIHRLVYADYWLDVSGGFAVVAATYGLWFWVYIVYTYILVATGVFWLLRILLRSPAFYRGQIITIILAAALPWIANLLFVFDLSPLPHLDLTTVSLNLTGLMVIWSVYRFRLLDIAPVARDELIENMIDGVVVLDANDRVVDINPMALSMMGYRANEVIGQPMLRFLESQPHLVARYRTVMETQEEISLGSGPNRRYFDLRISPLEDRRGRVTGRLIFLRNISQRKHVERLLQHSERRYQTLLENVPIGVFRCTPDSTGELLMANAAFLAMFGPETTQIASLFPHPNAWQAVVDQVQAQGRVAQIQAPLRRAGGGRLWASLSATLAQADTSDSQSTPDQAYLDCTVEDISDHKLRTLEREAILAISEAVRAAPTRSAMLPVILAQVMALVEAEAAILVLRDVSSDDLVVEAAQGLWSSAQGQRAPAPNSITAQTMTFGSPYMAAPGRHQWPLPDAASLPHVAVACAPLLVDGAAIGALWAARAHTFDADNVRILTAVANIAASAIQRVSLYEEVQRHAYQLEERVAVRTAELQAANERLKELDRLKSTFVSNVSHELRMPLANIKLYLNLLNREQPQHWQRNLDVIARETNLLSRLIEDLLDLSRLDMGKVQLVLTPLDLNELIEELVEQRAGLFDERNLHLTADLQPDLPPVLGDRQMLIQVTTNLMANAMNYTPAGGAVTMRTRLQTDHDRPWVVLTVSDTGRGISPEDQVRLFERFFRGDAARQSQAPGSGLGLAICQEIVERHRGAISVTSAIGRGASFHVHLQPTPTTAIFTTPP